MAIENEADTSAQRATITVTDSAAEKVWELIQEEDNYDLMLRAYITGGGCSGFQYGFTFDEQVNPDDHVITKKVQLEDAGEINLLVDAMSFQFLVGAKIDYQEGVQGKQFVIINPNAKTTCGCGSSFAV